MSQPCKPDYGFYFERSGRAATQGAIAPAEQFFEGSLAEQSLARETGQNSLDAAHGDGPVRMVFELADMPTSEIPDISRLRQHLNWVTSATKGSQGHERMVRAAELAHRDSVPVLRISDYGTKGLEGTESVDDPQSPLSALTRGAGISAADGARGGSFGIGSAVGPMASDLCTVLYTSKFHASADVVFAAYSRLASHRDADGVWRVGDGFFTDLNVEDDFRYARNPDAIGPFEQRTEAGTDIFVLGYRKADEDPGLKHIKVAFLENFLVAIHRGRLVVEGRGVGKGWILDSTTLAHHVKDSPQAAAFRTALLDPDPSVKELSPFGTVRLYVNIDDTLDQSLHTFACRSPLMRVHTFRHRSIPVRYAAILEVSDKEGNELLRSLEPPQHNTWDGDRAPGGNAAVRKLHDFVRDQLKSRVVRQVGDQVEITGLARYLPAQVVDKPAPPAAGGRRPVLGDGTAEEAASVHGAEQGEQVPAFNERRKAVRVQVRPPAGGEGDIPASQGKDSGGSAKRKSKGGDIPGSAQEGDGTARISSGQVRFRSWTDARTGILRVALTPHADVAGELGLVPLGPGGSREDDYLLPITSVVMERDGVRTSLDHDGNIIKGLDLREGQTTIVEMTFATRHRYRLAVR